MTAPSALEQVGHAYWRGPQALSEVSLQFQPGSFSALLGPNGSGKSTLLAVLGGIVRAGSGTVTVAGRDPARTSRADLARVVSYLPARPAAPPDYTGLELVCMARHPFGRGLFLEREEDLTRAREALERLGAAQFADREAAALSSGERQRVLLARVLCQDAQVLLLDEPTSALDPAHALEAFALLGELAQQGRTVVVATHDVNAAARHAERLVVLRRGRVISDGSPQQVLSGESLGRVFGVALLTGQDGEVPYVVPQGPLGQDAAS